MLQNMEIDCEQIFTSLEEGAFSTIYTFYGHFVSPTHLYPGEALLLNIQNRWFV